MQRVVFFLALSGVGVSHAKPSHSLTSSSTTRVLESSPDDQADREASAKAYKILVSKFEKEKPIQFKDCRKVQDADSGASVDDVFPSQRPKVSILLPHVENDSREVLVKTFGSFPSVLSFNSNKVSSRQGDYRRWEGEGIDNSELEAKKNQMQLEEWGTPSTQTRITIIAPPMNAAKTMGLKDGITYMMTQMDTSSGSYADYMVFKQKGKKPLVMLLTSCGPQPFNLKPNGQWFPYDMPKSLIAEHSLTNEDVKKGKIFEDYSGSLKDLRSDEKAMAKEGFGDRTRVFDLPWVEVK